MDAHSDIPEDLQYPEDIEWNYIEDRDHIEPNAMNMDALQPSDLTTQYNSPNPNPRPYIMSSATPGSRRAIMPSRPTKSPKTTQGTQKIPPAARKFGSMPDVPVGTTFASRKEASIIHPPLMAGIYADKDGAYSVVMSGGYIDDIDHGDVVTYTGEGGRNPKISEKTGKTSFSGVQTRDQVWERGNEGLRINSVEGRPIRLIRGPWDKLKSPYSHASKYRYDGLYLVEDAYQAPGKEGYLMCRFTFRRLPGQPAIPMLHDYDKRKEDLAKKNKKTRGSTKRDSEEMEYQEVESSATRAEKRAQLGLVEVPSNASAQPRSPIGKTNLVSPPNPSSAPVKLESTSDHWSARPVPSPSKGPFAPRPPSAYAGLKFKKIKREDP